MIIGLTGTYCAGKDTVANYLIQRGFLHISLSDLLRDILRSRNEEITRDRLIALANDLRKNFGSAILAYKALGMIDKNFDYVISSIRNPEEARVVLAQKGAHLVCIDADPKIRFERMFNRRRENDPETFEDFLTKEALEKSSDPTAQQLHLVNDLAEYAIANNGTPKELIERVDHLLEVTLRPKYHRLSWDEYFMEITKQVARRSTCDRGRTSAVIVKEKRLLTTGYSGSPIGLEHCDDIGHLFKVSYDKEGNKKQNCVRTTHAEQNAIAQAARFGISIDGATIYCSMEPCDICTKIVINAGIKRIVCEKKYHGAEYSREMLQKAGVKIEVLNEEVEHYKGQ